MANKKKGKGIKYKKRTGPSMAEQADIQELYEKSVQAPESDVEFYIDTYKALRGKEPMMLREDFCGTSLISLEWCKTDPKRTAISVDLDEATLEYGRKKHIEPAGKDISDRIQLVLANVMEVTEPKTDVTCAMNFSYWFFKTRDSLRDYFKLAHAGLKEDGILVLDIFGGTESMEEIEEEREVDDEDFEYIWDQHKFNPITHEMTCHIHFKFPDGSRLKRAFSYHWRMWTIPEVTELLQEAGFSKARVYWERFEDIGDEDELEGTGEYEEVTEAENQEAWINYIVAEK